MKPQPATLIAVSFVDIHGSKFVDVTFALHSKPDAPKVSRLGAESVYDGAKAGDEVWVSLLLGQLTDVKKVGEKT